MKKLDEWNLKMMAAMIRIFFATGCYFRFVMLNFGRAAVYLNVLAYTVISNNLQGYTCLMRLTHGDIHVISNTVGFKPDSAVSHVPCHKKEPWRHSIWSSFRSSVIDKQLRFPTTKPWMFPQKYIPFRQLTMFFFRIKYFSKRTPTHAQLHRSSWLIAA